jgi:hypothetical protein
LTFPLRGQEILEYLLCEERPLQGPVRQITGLDLLGQKYIREFGPSGKMVRQYWPASGQQEFFYYTQTGDLQSRSTYMGDGLIDSTAFRYYPNGERRQALHFEGDPAVFVQTSHYHYDSRNRPYFLVKSRMEVGIIQLETLIFRELKNKAALYLNQDWRQRTWWYYEARSGCLNPIIRYIKDKEGRVIAAYTKRMEAGKDKPTEVLIEYQNDDYGNWIRRTMKFIRRNRQQTFREETREIYYRTDASQP